MVAIEFPVIMESGHYYIVSVKLDPFDKKRYHDPCNSRCHKETQKEMKDLSRRLREGLKKGSVV